MNNKIKLGGGVTFLAVSLGFKFFMETLIKVSNYNEKEKTKERLKEAIHSVETLEELVNKLDKMKIKNTDSKQEEEVQ